MHLKDEDRSILVVEDDDRSSQLLKDVLEGNGYRVVLASKKRKVPSSDMPWPLPFSGFLMGPDTALVKKHRSFIDFQ